MLAFYTSSAYIPSPEAIAAGKTHFFHPTRGYDGIGKTDFPFLNSCRLGTSIVRKCSLRNRATKHFAASNLQEDVNQLEPSTDLSFLDDSMKTDLPPPSTTFEPVVDVPALSSFLVVFVLFGLLRLRVSAIEKASTRRERALERVRETQARRLSMEAISAAAMEEEVRAALEEYRRATTDEMDLRTIIPGVRVAAPNRPDVAAAKRYLGVDLDFDVDDTNGGSDGGGDVGEGGGNNRVSNLVAVVLVVLATAQIALLILLATVDPMASSNFP